MSTVYYYFNGYNVVIHRGFNKPAVIYPTTHIDGGHMELDSERVVLAGTILLLHYSTGKSLS